MSAGARLARLDPEARHHLRIRGKGLRYAADVFDQLFTGHPKRARRYLAALEEMLEALGALNDIVTARLLASALPEGEALAAAEAEREAVLTAQARRAFKALAAVKPYWR